MCGGERQETVKGEQLRDECQEMERRQTVPSNNLPNAAIVSPACIPLGHAGTLEELEGRHVCARAAAAAATAPLDSSRVSALPGASSRD